jgi:hypothetical protein
MTGTRRRRARARHADPPTSVAAAKSVGDLTEKQRAVLTVMRHFNKALLDEEIVENYQMNRTLLHLPQQSDSGIRSRRAELYRLEKIVQHEKRRMSTGRMGRTWRIKEG